LGFSCYCLVGQRICITDAILLFSAKIINIAGKQRMLSQKIAWHSNALINQTDNHAQHLQSLKHSLELFEQAHEYLLTKDEQGDAVYLNTSLFDLYYAPPKQLKCRGVGLYNAS
jgi:nitrate/nitrite-specific signal transduction histidine kinase